MVVRRLFPVWWMAAVTVLAGADDEGYQDAIRIPSWDRDSELGLGFQVRIGIPIWDSKRGYVRSWDTKMGYQLGIPRHDTKLGY